MFKVYKFINVHVGFIKDIQFVGVGGGGRYASMLQHTRGYEVIPIFDIIIIDLSQTPLTSNLCH